MDVTQIKILLHYYDKGDSELFSEYPKSSKEIEAYFQIFVKEGLLNNSMMRQDCYKITDGGILFVEALMNVPTPIRKWVIPDSWNKETDDGLRKSYSRENNSGISCQTAIQS